MWLPCKIKNMSLTPKPVLKMLDVMVHVPNPTTKARTTGDHWLDSLAYLVSAREELASKTNGQTLSNILQQVVLWLPCAYVHVHMHMYMYVFVYMCMCTHLHLHTQMQR